MPHAEEHAPVGHHYHRERTTVKELEDEFDCGEPGCDHSPGHHAHLDAHHHQFDDHHDHRQAPGVISKLKSFLLGPASSAPVTSDEEYIVRKETKVVRVQKYDEDGEPIHHHHGHAHDEHYIRDKAHDGKAVLEDAAYDAKNAVKDAKRKVQHKASDAKRYAHKQADHLRDDVEGDAELVKDKAEGVISSFWSTVGKTKEKLGSVVYGTEKKIEHAGESASQRYQRLKAEAADKYDDAKGHVAEESGKRINKVHSKYENAKDAAAADYYRVHGKYENAKDAARAEYYRVHGKYEDAKDAASSEYNRVKGQAADKYEQTRQRANEEVDNVRHKVDETREEAAARVKSVADSASRAVKGNVAKATDTVKSAKDSVKYRVDETADAVKQRVGEAKNRVDETAQNVKQRVGEAKNRVDETAENVKQRVGEAKHRVHDSIDQARDNVEDAARRAKASAREKAQNVKDGVREGVDNVKEGVKDGIHAVEDGAEGIFHKFEQAGECLGLSGPRTQGASHLCNSLDGARSWDRGHNAFAAHGHNPVPVTAFYTGLSTLWFLWLARYVTSLSSSHARKFPLTNLSSRRVWIARNRTKIFLGDGSAELAHETHRDVVVSQKTTTADGRAVKTTALIHAESPAAVRKIATLVRAAHARSSFANMLPVFLVLLGSLELSGAYRPLLHLLSVAFLIGNVLQSEFGIFAPNALGSGRAIGLAIDWAVLLSGAVMAIYLAVSCKGCPVA
ncbi:hypothetical protein HKX48_005892 [Thoreauomyces humboldtii]|nr:hypothetical protein HKX48_005892 [Thoreauomyces humboldtii]